MTTLRCLLAGLDDLPADPAWLGVDERDTAHALKVEKRRLDWLLGRYAAKCALAASTGVCDGRLARWEIRADSDGAPSAWLDGQPAPAAISLSHSSGQALCVVGPADIAPGCDLERIERRDPSFVETFFTPAECALVTATPEDQRPLLNTLIWSAKESALKVLRHGLRKDTRCIEVEVELGDSSATWQPLLLQRTDSARPLHGWWQTAAGFVLTVAADRRTHAPKWLCDGPELSRPPDNGSATFT